MRCMTTKNAPNPDNQVFLRGRLASEPTVRVLPSGDELCSFRLTVPRPPGGRRPVDSLECSSTRPPVRRRVEKATPGDEVEVTGQLHRNFWRGAGGPTSRYEVDVLSARVTSRRRSGA